MIYGERTEASIMKVATYCRVSTDKEDQVNSYETQQRYFRDYIQNQPGWELCEIYADEGVTGTSTKKRVNFNRMINDAYAGRFQMILTKEVSRFSRNILDTISYTRELKAIGVGVLFVTDRINTLDPEAEMLLSFLASMAQEESRRTSSRVVWGQTRQMERGVVFGPSLLGYDVNGGRIAVNPEGAQIIRLIFHKYALEKVSTSQIAKFLTSEGYRTYRGNTIWRPNAVIKILKNEKYVGDLVQKKTYTPDFLTHEKKRNTGQVPMVVIQNHHEPIISREVWDLAQKQLRRNNKHNAAKESHSNRYVFSGKIKCGECGSSFVGRFKSLKDGVKLRRWSCGKTVRDGVDACDVGKLLRDDDALSMLKTVIKRLPIDFASMINTIAELAFEAIQIGEPETEDSPQRIRQKIDRVHQKKEAVMDAYFSKVLSLGEMNVMRKKYDEQLFVLQKNLIAAQTCQKEAQSRTVSKAEIVKSIHAILDGNRESEVFYKTILHSITVYKDRHMELRLNGLPHIFIFAG